ncbi:winged helix-turn-helix transcriptional regulator [Nocardia cyriacigeorgica]|uniref:Helix-turn-helix transcriptional regulator n=1 Tax=Nocardia cyriacigeorgica TaxID=135487 RepID=A0A6P1D619_9NOCA|nr:helix-turn-helix domain-containing protein [Nocardia cyriacigeorgica]NEW44834.1 helix-turn-helix transcriptional regulator [Nocardia cyriacigeorgica]
MEVGFRAGTGAAPARSDVFDSDCPARTVLDKLTSRWGVLILSALCDGPLRFHVLRDRIGGISEKMLSQNLRSFTEFGLTERSVEPTSPPSVTYTLTPMGEEAAERLRGLLGWVATNAEAIVEFQSGSTSGSNPHS